MATYTHYDIAEPIIIDPKNYADYLYNGYLQGCLDREIRIPSKKAIKEFIETGKASPAMARFVNAMRDLVNEFNQDAVFELEAEEIMADLPPELW